MIGQDVTDVSSQIFLTIIDYSMATLGMELGISLVTVDVPSNMFFDLE